MAVAVDGDLVSAVFDLAHEIGKPVGEPPEDEERRPRRVPVECVEQKACALVGPELELVPLGPVEDVGEVLNAEPVLEVDRNRVRPRSVARHTLIVGANAVEEKLEASSE